MKENIKRIKDLKNIINPKTNKKYIYEKELASLVIDTSDIQDSTIYVYYPNSSNLPENGGTDVSATQSTIDVNYNYFCIKNKDIDFTIMRILTISYPYLNTRSEMIDNNSIYIRRLRSFWSFGSRYSESDMFSLAYRHQDNFLVFLIRCQFTNEFDLVPIFKPGYLNNLRQTNGGNGGFLYLDPNRNSIEYNYDYLAPGYLRDCIGKYNISM